MEIQISSNMFKHTMQNNNKLSQNNSFKKWLYVKKFR